jgi:hypothetical protein
MTNLTIPSSIISIESNAFSSCNALTTVLFNGDRPELDEATSFNNTAGTIGYYYPDKTGWPGTAITGITLTSLLEITGTKSEGNTLTATQYLSTIGATGLSYRWYSNTSNSNSGGSVIAGATSSTYSYSSSYAYVYVVVSYTMSGSSTSLTSNAF